jgi:hypothetical protein
VFYMFIYLHGMKPPEIFQDYLCPSLSIMLYLDAEFRAARLPAHDHPDGVYGLETAFSPTSGSLYALWNTQSRGLTS